MDSDKSEDQKQRYLYIAYVALVLMNVIDVLYTRLAFEYGAIEINELMNWLYMRYDISGIVLYKVFVLSVILFFAIPMLKGKRKLQVFYYLMVIVYLVLTIYHISWYYEVEVPLYIYW